MTLTALGLAIAIGIVMGLLGGGGSILAVPALTLLLHFTPKEAVVISLSVVAIAATAGAIGSFIRGTLPLAAGLIVGLAATAGALIGGFAGAQLADGTQLRILGVVMLDPRNGIHRRGAGVAVALLITVASIIGSFAIADNRYGSCTEFGNTGRYSCDKS